MPSQVPLIQFIQKHRGGEGHIEGGEDHPPERREQPQASQIESTTPSPVEGASLSPSVDQNEDLTDHVSSHPSAFINLLESCDLRYGDFLLVGR